jgi:hypothetical protein
MFFHFNRTYPTNDVNYTYYRLVKMFGGKKSEAVLVPLAC